MALAAAGLLVADALQLTQKAVVAVRKVGGVTQSSVYVDDFADVMRPQMWIERELRVEVPQRFRLGRSITVRGVEELTLSDAGTPLTLAPPTNLVNSQRSVRLTYVGLAG